LTRSVSIPLDTSGVTTLSPSCPHAAQTSQF
jgi:hypothetical protein